MSIRGSWSPCPGLAQPHTMITDQPCPPARHCTRIDNMCVVLCRVTNEPSRRLRLLQALSLMKTTTKAYIIKTLFGIVSQMWKHSLEGAFNQEEALVGPSLWLWNLHDPSFEALVDSPQPGDICDVPSIGPVSVHTLAMAFLDWYLSNSWPTPTLICMTFMKTIVSHY